MGGGGRGGVAGPGAYMYICIYVYMYICKYYIRMYTFADRWIDRDIISHLFLPFVSRVSASVSMGTWAKHFANYIGLTTHGTISPSATVLSALAAVVLSFGARGTCRKRRQVTQHLRL